MGLSDLLFYPAYLLLFYFFFSARRKALTDPVLKHYHRQGFWIKALMVIPFALFNSKISLGDSYGLYQLEGNHIFKMILHDPSNIHWILAPGSEYDQSGLLGNDWNAGYCRDTNNFAIVRIVTVLSFVTFGKYIVNCLVFSMVSFTGIWRLYRFFYEQYPHLHKQLAVGILYLPTFVFWCSGILKDPLCVGALGWITYALYEAFYKKKALIKNLAILLVAGYVLVILKIYILVSYTPFLILFLVLKNVNLIKSGFAKFIVVAGLFTGAMLGFTQIMNGLQDSMKQFAGGGITKTIQTYQKSYAAQENWAESNFSLGVEFDGSTLSLIKMAPAAIAATFYRPFIWETRKPATVLTSLESMAIMLFTLKVLFSVGFFNFFKSWRDPAILYCISFSILFGIFVGSTTPNFGTLCRYKIPCMPFYVLAMILIMDYYGKWKPKIKNSPEKTGLNEVVSEGV